MGRSASFLKLAFSMMVVGTVSCFAVPSAWCGEPSALSVHGQITHDALAGTLAAGNLDAVIKANDSQDSPGGDGLQEKRRHFDGSNLQASVNYVNREKNRAFDLAAEADSDAQSRADALRHFGLLLHSVQDFYLRSNYVEMQLEEAANREAPYDIPLVDWSRVPAGYLGSGGAKLVAARHGDATDLLNKESQDSQGGRKAIAGKITQFSVARDLAVRETQRQWNLFETIIRSHCGVRAPAVLAALRQAPPAGDAGKKQASESVADY